MLSCLKCLLPGAKKGAKSGKAKDDAAPYYSSGPLSEVPPSPLQMRLNDELLRYINTCDVFESVEELKAWSVPIRCIETLFKEWIRRIAQRKVASSRLDLLGGKVSPFGSYQLKVQSRGSPVDLLCLAPRQILRTDFFSSFVKALKEDGHTTMVTALPNAVVPSIKVRYMSHAFNLFFVRLRVAELPATLQITDELAAVADLFSIRSLNGLRTTEELLRLVPNREVFCVSLKAVTIWANSHYAGTKWLSSMGWATLLARTCQLFPNTVPAVVLQHLFGIFSMWNWKKHAVSLSGARRIRSKLPYSTAALLGRKKGSKSKPLVRILPPGLFEQNAMSDVSSSERKLFSEKLSEGCRFIDLVMAEDAPWSSLFESSCVV